MVARASATLERARSARESSNAAPACLLALIVLFGASTLAPARAEAESAWVRGGLRLNLRTEPGTQYRILGVLETGNRVEVLRQTEDWTNVRLPGGEQGWIPKGYLRSDPPPAIQLEQTESELVSLRTRLEKGEASVLELRTLNDELTERNSGQRETIERLSAENTDLKQGRRWPEWITGASVLTAGMLLGGILHRNATRRPAARIRL